MGRRAAKITHDEVIMNEFDLYAVRVASSKEIVCFAQVRPIYGELALANWVDEYANVKKCEYARMEQFALGWTGTAPTMEDLHDGILHESRNQPPYFSDAMDPTEDIKWTPFGSGYIYFVESSSRIKIGFSNDVKSRVAKLRTATPDQISFIGARPGSRADEFRLHKLYQRLRATGEWFHWTDPLTVELSELKLADGFCREIDDVKLPAFYWMP